MPTPSRRQFLGTGLGLMGLSLASGCGMLPILTPDPARAPRIGLLHYAPTSLVEDRVEAFRQGLREVGYVEGQNVVVDYRNSEGQLDHLREHTADLVRSKVDVIVSGGPRTTRIARDATETVPIVMTFDPDPVGSGFAASLARPGGNVTGLSSLAPVTGRKSLEILKAITPGVSRVAILGSSSTPGDAQTFSDTEVAARTLSIQLQYLDIRDPADIDPAFRAAVAGSAEGVLVQSGAVLIPQRRTIVNLAARDRLPLMAFAQEGGLMTYAVRLVDLDHRAAAYVDKILKGAKPADLPVEQPTTFDFVVNLKTAQALGLTIPQSVLQQATEIIQ